MRIHPFAPKGTAIAGILVSLLCLGPIAQAATLDEVENWLLYVKKKSYPVVLSESQKSSGGAEIAEVNMTVAIEGRHATRGSLKLAQTPTGEVDASFFLQDPRTRRNDYCSGTLAENSAFLVGSCRRNGPFVMVPSAGESLAKENLENTRVALNQCRKKANDLKYEIRKQAAQSAHCAESNTPKIGGRAEALKAAERAVTTIPTGTRGGNCAKCDAVTYLDVPNDPPRGSGERKWLTRLLSEQQSTIDNMWDHGGVSVLKSEEDETCRGSLNCVALFRQNAIAFGLDLLGSR